MRACCLMLVTLFALGLTSAADIVFMDDFENVPLVESGNPPGWTIFGAPVLDRGMYTTQNHSPSASVWVAVSWAGWGWGATTDASTYDVGNDETTVSCWMRANENLSAGSVAMTIFDADGTQWRTADASLFQLTTDWAQYSSQLGDMVVEAAGTTPGLDYANIVNFGFLAYTAGQTGEDIIQFDDFAVDTIPEPATLTATALGLAFLLFRRFRQRAA
ncbi:MAG: PEP-CTERM sorting domain-containing protein [Kiritimatiellae bacterium]|nr:PEP-CTERM sorting domain-containing protein [Kiritimatiellia bacterium]